MSLIQKKTFVRPVLISLTILNLLLSAPPLLSQKRPADQRVRLAQSYENAGKFEEALGLYRDLYATDSTNVVFFDGLLRMQIQLKRYSEAAALLELRLAGNPRDVGLRSQLAGVLYKDGQEERAYAEWDKAIAVDSTDARYYRIVGSSLVDNRLLDRATSLYRRARVACGDPDLFTLELAQLFTASMDYHGATAELVRWLKANPGGLSFVETKMSSVTSSPEGRADAIDEVLGLLKQEESLPLMELLGWLHLEGKDYEGAYQVNRRIDRLTNAHGGRIFAFAEQAFRERAFKVAAEAYQEAVGIPVPASKLPAARYGYASCLKELSILADSTGDQGPGPLPADGSMPRFSEAIAEFREIIAAHPRTEYAARSYFQIGLIQYERSFDLDGALESLGAVERELPPGSTVFYFVSLKMGEVFTAKGDTASAAKRFRDVMKAPGATPDQQDEATFRMAELAYFGGRFGGADSLLSGLTLDLKVDYANDALRLLSFLRENAQTAPDALTEFAHAEYLARQHKNGEAIPLFFDIVQRYPGALLIDDALMKAARLQAESGLYDQSVATYERILGEFTKSSIALDDAQFAIGSIYQFRLRDAGKATSAYEKVLADFPQSLHVTEARKRIRELRGESL